MMSWKMVTALTPLRVMSAGNLGTATDVPGCSYRYQRAPPRATRTRGTWLRCPASISPVRIPSFHEGSASWLSSSGLSSYDLQQGAGENDGHARSFSNFRCVHQMHPIQTDQVRCLCFDGCSHNRSVF